MTGGWKSQTTKIRRHLHVVTYIRDEFLDSEGKVLKELHYQVDLFRRYVGSFFTFEL